MKKKEMKQRIEELEQEVSELKWKLACFCAIHNSCDAREKETDDLGLRDNSLYRKYKDCYRMDYDETFKPKHKKSGDRCTCNKLPNPITNYKEPCPIHPCTCNELPHPIMHHRKPCPVHPDREDYMPFMKVISVDRSLHVT